MEEEITSLLKKTSNSIARTLRVGLFCIVLAGSLPAQEQDIDLSRLSGREIYVQFCSRCHGEDGKGNIPEEMLQNMEAPPPDLTEPYFNSAEKRLAWFRVIKFGGDIEGLSMSMPSWGESFSDKQIQEMIEYMKSFIPQDDYPQGELNFLRAHSVTKAYVEQEALIIPAYTLKNARQRASETATILYYANRFGNRFQYEVKAPIKSVSSPLRNDWGLGDIELGVKYAFFDDYIKGTIASVGFEVELPTGDEGRGFGKGTVVAVPYFAAGMSANKFLELQGSARIDAPLDPAMANAGLKYGVSAVLILSDSRQGLFPGFELSGQKNLTSEESVFSIIPKVYVGLTRRGHVAISFGIEIPISAQKPFNSRWLAFFLWDYADSGIWW